MNMALSKNKMQINDGLVNLKNSKQSNELDMLFAELFALVNLNEENLSNTLTHNKVSKSKENIEEDNSLNLKNDEEFLLTRSLAETFYKELGINEKDFGVISKENNTKNSEMNLRSGHNPRISELINHLKIQSKELNQLKNFRTNEVDPKENLQNKLENMSDFKIEIMSPKKKDFEIGRYQLSEDRQKSESILTKDVKTNVIKESKNTLNIDSSNNSKEIFISSKEKKASKKRLQHVDPIQKNSEEKSFTLTDKKQLLLKQPVILSKTKDSKANNLSVESRNIKEFENLPKNKSLINNQVFNDQHTLDLLESSWGEKFTKVIKNSIINGTNKIDFSLKPKNLGKINVEVSVKDNKALIQINAESSEAANILNENIQKLNEIINYKNEKFAGFNENGNNAFSNNQKQSSKDSNDNSFVKKKSAVKSELNKINNHNIDVNA